MAMRTSEVEIQKYLLGLAQKYVGKRKPLQLSSRLFHDLGLAGDDAWEFFEEVSQNFNLVDPKFDFEEYFPAEKDIKVWPFYLFEKKEPDRWKPMTIETLSRIILRGLSEN